MVLDQHGEHGRPLARHVLAQHHDVGMLLQHRQRVLQVRLLALADPVPAQLVLYMTAAGWTHVHVERQTAADGAHDVGSAALLTVAQHLAVPTLEPGRKNYRCMSLLT